MSHGKAGAAPDPDPAAPNQSVLGPRQPDEALMHELVWLGSDSTPIPCHAVAGKMQPKREERSPSPLVKASYPTQNLVRSHVTLELALL